MSSTSCVPPAPGVSRTRQFAAFGVIYIAELLIVLDTTIINVALPSIGIELETGISGLQWVVDAYTLTFSGLLLAFGNLGDRYGRLVFLLIGLTGLGLTSIIGALGDTLPQVIVSRSLMGIFAAAVLPATLAVITNLFPEPKERALAIGVWSSIAGVAVAIGPVSGGWLLEHFSWHSVFWLNVPIAIIAVVAVALVVPEYGTMPVLVTGSLLIGVGLIVAGQVQVGSSYLTLVLPAMLLLAVGIAIIQGPATESIMSSLPLDEAGAGSAVNDTTREIGGTLGVAVLGSEVAAYFGAAAVFVCAAFVFVMLPRQHRTIGMLAVNDESDTDGPLVEK